jgi:hypothetical protein
MENQIEIYKSGSSQIEVKVQFEKNTVWLSQKQMAELFDKDSDTIGLHLKNIFAEEELVENSTTEFFSVVQKEGKRAVARKIKCYNLDAIISVGYRVNSKRGTQFRIWATQRLKEYLVKGYAINPKRLDELQQTIELISKGSGMEALQLQEARGLLEIISNYTNSFVLLNKFDSNNLTTEKLSENITYEIKYDDAI